MIADTVLTAETTAAEATQAAVVKRSLPAIDERYAQRHPLQIAVCLRSIETQGDFLSVEFEGGQILTQILEVDSRNARFVFDLGGLDEANAALAAASALTFRSEPSGVRTEFATSGAVRTTFEGRPAFEASFPTLLYYVQRREYFRVDTPVTNPFVASGCEENGDTYRLELKDLSLGGVALRTADARFSMIAIGTVWKDVSICLGSFGSVTVDLEVVAPRNLTAPNGDVRSILGCRFLGLPGSAERILQRTVTQLETRRLGARGRG